MKPVLVDSRLSITALSTSLVRVGNSVSAHQSQVPKPVVREVSADDTISWLVMVSQSTNYKESESSHTKELNGLVDRGILTLAHIFYATL